MPLQPSELLHYLPAYRVLICKECHYAIQPSAISGHLKDLHHIYRSHRRTFMEYVLRLDLANPEDVVLPEPHESPVPFLPTERGLACESRGCGHLCVTVKRMKTHWTTMHHDRPAGAALWRPVHLQTFFRGNRLRYFIVCISSAPAAQLERKLDVIGKDSRPEIDKAEVPLTNDSDWTAEDLDLFEHFKSSSDLDLAFNLEAKQVWHVAIPQLAVNHSFLKHGILACSALHLAYLNPLERQRYKLTAAYHQDQALPEFRSSIMNANEDNCHALLAFSQLLIVHCFASDEQDENLLLVGGKHESDLPDWLNIIRNGCVIFENVLEVMNAGPLTPLLVNGIEKNRRIDEVPENPKISERLRHLAEIPLRGNCHEATLRAFPDALLELSRAFSKAEASRHVFDMWTAVYIWPAQVPLAYLDLLRDRSPAALILLAHYCILLKPLESHWYISSLPKRLLSRIYRQLDPEWRHWLQWPIEEIGLQL